MGYGPPLVKLHLGRVELPERTNDSGSIQRDVTSVSVLSRKGVVRSLHSSSPPARLAGLQAIVNRIALYTERTGTLKAIAVLFFVAAVALITYYTWPLVAVVALTVIVGTLGLFVERNNP